MSDKSLTITFTDPPSAGDGDSLDNSGNKSSEPVSLALDSARHIEVYGEAKTTFSVEDTVYLKLLHQFGDTQLSFFSSNSDEVSFKIAARKIHFAVIESISYIHSNSESITYSPADPIPTQDIEWLSPIDGNLVTVRQRNKEFKIVSSPADDNTMSGSLQISYTTLGDRLEVTSVLAGDVIVGVTIGGVDYSQTITFTAIPDSDPDPGTVLKDYTINVTSLCASGVIGGVAVSKDGASLGNTDGYGQITFTSYPGTYTFSAIRTGYTTISKSVTLA